MNEQLSLEEYKQKVRECLINIQNCTVDDANKLMDDYDDDFEEALYEFTWSPITMASAMLMGY